MRRPIGVKFCKMINSRPNLIMPVPLQFLKGDKNWLKIKCIRRKIFEGRGNSLMKCFHLTCARSG